MKNGERERERERETETETETERQRDRETERGLKSEILLIRPQAHIYGGCTTVYIHNTL